MKASDLITEEVPTLKPESTVKEAIAISKDYCLCDIPIIKEEYFIGTLPVDFIGTDDEEEKSLGAFNEDFKHASVDTNQHILNIFEVAAENELTVIPVTKEGKLYEGSITITRLLNHFARIYSFKEKGGIFTLEIPFKNYDLSEIARIVESNNSKILSLFTETLDNDNKVFITVKVNTIDLRPLQATFERFNYKIDVHHLYNQKDSDLKDRYDLLIKYLNI